MHRCQILVPCYNEENRLDQHEFSSFIEKHPNFDFVFIDDGSMDGTPSILQNLKDNFTSRIEILTLPTNAGKGKAIYMGFVHSFSNSDYKYVGYIDADLSAPLSSLILLYKELEKFYQIDAAIGTRIKLLGTHIERSEFRHYVSRIFITVSNFLLNLSVYDSQCGAKLFLMTTLQDKIKTEFVSRWFFDLELLILLGEENIIEVPLHEWVAKKESKLKFKDYISAIFEILKIKKKYNV